MAVAAFVSLSPLLVRCGAPRARRARARRALSCSAARLSRRAVLSVGVAAALGPMAAALAEEGPPALPGGARELSAVVSARQRWADVGSVVGRGVGGGEWAGLKAFLRAFYAVGGDMEKLGKGWGGETEVKERVKEMRKVVKGMDKVASEEGEAEFGRMWKEVDATLDWFFEEMTRAKQDIPMDI